LVAAAGYPGPVRTVTRSAVLQGPERRRGVPRRHREQGRRGRYRGGPRARLTALGVSLQQARERAYAVVDAIELPGKQARRDIGART